jgi:hypothetical protein
MKITITSENAKDIRDIREFLGIKGEIKHRKHKRHQFMKECSVCGNHYKGSRGLGIHMATHIKSPVRLGHDGTRKLSVSDGN